MGMNVHEMLAMKAPITFEIACKAWGDDPNLCDDSTRKCFFAVWALLCFEWAEAMVEHAQSRKVNADKTANAPHEGPGTALSRTVPLDAVVGEQAVTRGKA